MSEANSINAATTGIVGNTGTAFTGSPATQHCVQIGGSTTSTLVSVTNGSTGQFLGANTGADPTWQTLTSGTQVKQVRVSTAATTSLGVFPNNPVSAPQNTDGTEIFTLAITPANSANILVFEGIFCISAESTNLGSPNVCIGLFQDSTATGLYANFSMQAYNLNSSSDFSTFTIPFMYYMTAGTTSSTTFRIRAGYDSSTYAGSAARLNWDFGNVANFFAGKGLCILTITEYTA